MQVIVGLTRRVDLLRRQQAPLDALLQAQWLPLQSAQMEQHEEAGVELWVGTCVCLMHACLPNRVPGIAHHAEAVGPPKAPFSLRLEDLHMMRGKASLMAQ